jgi:CheY-like chemotaxis protein
MNATEIVDSLNKVLDALSRFVWPVLAVYVFLRLFPSLRGIIESRAFTVKVGNMEISVQQASDQLAKQIQDLQDKVAAFTPHADAAAARTPALQSNGEAPLGNLTVLWVDDVPSNNAYEIAKLRGDGVEVIEATSTDEAMGIIASSPRRIDIIITDMGRKEHGTFNPKAGLDLIRGVRAAGSKVPIFVYSSARGIQTDEIERAGATGKTTSPVELIKLVQASSTPAARQDGPRQP